MSATATSTDRNLPLLQKARELIAKGDLKNAAITLNDANRTMPGDARVFMLGGLMAEKASNTKAAFESMRKAVSLAPEWGPGLLELALLLARNNQFDEAIATAEKVHKLEPRNPMVLAGAVDIAHRAGHLEMAIRLLKHGLSLHPDDPQLTILLATDLALLGQNNEALALWNTLATDHPDSPDVLLGRLKANLALGQLTEAVRDGESLMAIDPENAVFSYHAALSKGQTPAQQPTELAQQLFDSMAATYDSHMVRSLGYRLPQQVAEKLLHAHPDKKFNALDLGCGTGLLGACLGRLDGALVGVDVSREMITQAVKHDVYDKFHTVNVHDALDATPESLYDVIAALDVFIYAGDVSKAIPDAHRILVPGGTLVASFETAPEDGENLVLLLSGRYSHKRSHVAKMCEMAGFAKVDIEDTVLRLENGEPVNGFVVWATKVTAKPAKAPRSPRVTKAPSVKASA
jgi:predicted TPR repeat methyltransferase